MRTSRAGVAPPAHGRHGWKVGAVWPPGASLVSDHTPLPGGGTARRAGHAPRVVIREVAQPAALIGGRDTHGHQEGNLPPISTGAGRGRASLRHLSPLTRVRSVFRSLRCDAIALLLRAVVSGSWGSLRGTRE